MTNHAPTPETDRTFDDVSLYGSVKWVAAAIGRSRSWFDTHRAHLETQGFPRADAVTKLYLKQDVLAWANRRRQIADSIDLATTTESPARINDDAL